MGCQHCGEKLCATKRKRYCSDACRQAAYRNRKPTPHSHHPQGGVTVKQPSLQPSFPLYEGLKPYVYPEPMTNPSHGSNPDGSTPGALQGDDYPLTYDADGHPELPACLDRRKPKMEEAA